MSDRPTDPLLIDIPGHRECLLGNEAIVRGALESGVAFASGYPGTPSSEITDSFARVADSFGMTFEYSVNEKIALEMAFAASLAGARSICAMKHLGLMYAGDPLSTIPYVGAVAGMVIVSAGDPSCRTSPNEQDQRHLAPMLHVPMLDPSTPGEAYAMARFAFELSEKAQLPVILRPTTRVCHSRAIIEYGRLGTPEVRGFVRNPKRFVPIPVNARPLRIDLKERMKRAGQLMADSDFIRVEGDSKLAVVATGGPAAICADLLVEKELAEQVLFVTLGTVYPLPEKRLVTALGGVERLLVVEELSPFLEDKLSSLCTLHGLDTKILGKRTGHFPEEFEYDTELIATAIHRALEVGSAPVEPRAFDPVPPRPPSLCPGCPHRSAQFALRTVFGEESLYFNDIGCYTLGYGPPLQTADALLCMGSGLTIAAGVARTTKQRTVGILGDSTFFHSGMPALLNAIKENANMVAVILDNQVTAMTGFQESPLIKTEGEISRDISIADVARSLGAPHVETIDPYNLPGTIAAFERARDAEGVSVVVVQRPCPNFFSRQTHKPYKTGTYAIDHALCQTCGRESQGMRCQECVTEGFERNLARSRAVETGADEEPRLASAPCSTVCPVGLCVQGYTGHVAAGEYTEAWSKIISQLPLPESVCRVCHRPCEAVCVRASLDEAVAINDLKRFVTEWAEREGVPYEPAREPPSGKKVAIVGAGPAGLGAAHSLALRGHDVSLFDANDNAGGLLRTGIPEYRLPTDVLDRDIARILSLGVKLVGNTVLGRDVQAHELLARGFDALFIGVGAHEGIRLELEGENSAGAPTIIDALGFLKAVNGGREVDVGKRVVVIGGGNSALDAARTAKRMGADSVVIAYRRTRDEMPGLVTEITAAENEGIGILTQIQPVRLVPGGVACVLTERGELDASGRRRPVPIAGSEQILEADQILAAIGQRPAASLVAAEDLDLTRHEDGSLAVDTETLQTSDARVFAGGDVVPGGRTVTEAIAAGQRAAWGIDRLLRGAETADRRAPPPLTDPGVRSTRVGVGRAQEPRHHPPELSADERGTSFDEVVGSFDETAARAEAARCMVCGTCGNCRACVDLFGCPAFFVTDGTIHIDPQLCMGCGVCADFCPNGAIYHVENAGLLQVEGSRK